MSLYQYFWTNQGKPIRKWAHYLPLYERYFSPWVNRNLVMLEIGTGNGGSAQMWKHFFGPTAQIITADIRPECKDFADEQIAVRIGDQGDHEFLQSIIDEFGAPDIVLDDGSHQAAHICRSFEYLFPKMPRDALYLVEDLHASYWPDFGGGLNRSGTFIERLKVLMDEIHAHYIDSQPISSEIGKLVRGIHLHDSVAVIEKGPFVNRTDLLIPERPNTTRW